MKRPLTVLINQYADVVVVMSFWIFPTMPVSGCPVLERLSSRVTSATRSRDRATPALHSSPRCSHGEKTGERGASKEPIPRQNRGFKHFRIFCTLGIFLSRVPWLGFQLCRRRFPRGHFFVSPRERRFQHFRRRFPPRIFRIPCLGFQLYGRRFFRGCKIFIPRGFFFVSPGILTQRLSVRLCAHRSVFRASLTVVFFVCFFFAWVLV